MKILYIANEFRDVQVAARALRSISPNVTVLWGSNADRAAFWIRENPDLAALVVEVQTDSQGCAFLKHARSLGLNAPVVVVLPEGAAPPRESLEAGADDYVAKNQSFSSELPAVVTRTIERAQTVSVAWDHLVSETVLADAAGSTSTPDRRPGNLEASLHQREQSRAIEQSAAAERQEELEELIHRERTTRTDLEQKLARSQAELTSMLSEATERQAEFLAQLEQEVERRRRVEALLAHAETARDEAEKRHASAMAIAADALAERQAQFDAELAEAAAALLTLGQQARDLEALFDGARQTLASHAAEIDRLTRHEAELTSTLTDAAATRHTLERRMADTEAALGAANERLSRERLVAVEQATERQTEFQAQLEQEVERRRSVEELLARAETAVTTAATLLAERQAQFDAELADAAATRNTLEQRLANSDTAFRDADERATHNRLAAAERAAEREADLDELIRQERVTRALVEQKLAHVEAAWRDAEQQHASAMTIAATAQTERQTQFETEVSQSAALRDDLSRRLSNVEAALEHSRRLEVDHREERDSLERGRLAAEAEIGRLAAEHTEAQRNLEEARRDFQHTLDRISSEYADAQATLVASVSERDARLEEEAARHSASLQAVERDRSQLQDDLQTSVAARDREIEQLRGSLEQAIQELAGARTRCEVLQTELPQLQQQLDESRLETRRQFHRTPLALVRCTRDGALTHANRAFADMVGYRKPDELRSADFVKTVFESPDDLSWLIERCLSTHAKVSVETAWKRQNGERVAVRLSAVESGPDLVEIAAEDITNLRALQDRLGQAHRMEAVGRLASEIAVTCGNLLRDVHQDAQQWLMTVSDNAALRQRGERLLDEVTRAAGFLQQLAAYGDEQTSALEPVDLNRVLRDLKPVLKQVAGDEVALELPKISSPLNVDVKAERVERLLVNLASYGRERMPSGGRLKFELAAVVVDQRFIAQYPSVRQGSHALITVTEVRRDTRDEGSLQLDNRATTTPGAGGVAIEKPGVDLGALQELIRECDGHLWMTVEPSGNMVVKIHLPLRGGDDQAHPHGSRLWALGSGLWARVRGSD